MMNNNMTKAQVYDGILLALYSSIIILGHRLGIWSVIFCGCWDWYCFYCIFVVDMF